jgi:hypothetical protein
LVDGSRKGVVCPVSKKAGLGSASADEDSVLFEVEYAVEDTVEDRLDGSSLFFFFFLQKWSRGCYPSYEI